VCLAYKDQQVPTREAKKDELFAAGLGEKKYNLMIFVPILRIFKILCTKLFLSYEMEEGINC